MLYYPGASAAVHNDNSVSVSPDVMRESLRVPRAHATEGGRKARSKQGRGARVRGFPQGTESARSAASTAPRAAARRRRRSLVSAGKDTTMRGIVHHLMPTQRPSEAVTLGRASV